MKTTVYRDSGFRSENLKWNDQMLCEVGIYLKGGSTAHPKCLRGTYWPKKEGTTAQQVLTSVSRPRDTARKGSCAFLTSAGEHQPRVASSPAPVLSLPPDPGTAFLPGRLGGPQGGPSCLGPPGLEHRYSLSTTFVLHRLGPGHCKSFTPGQQSKCFPLASCPEDTP